MGMPTEVEHLILRAACGRTEEENLWLSCRRCNEFKGTQTAVSDPNTAELVALFHPRRQKWEEHFHWSEDGTEIVGLTPTGRATVVALKLNNQVIVVTRKLWVSAGWWPPVE